MWWESLSDIMMNHLVRSKSYQNYILFKLHKPCLVLEGSRSFHYRETKVASLILKYSQTIILERVTIDLGLRIWLCYIIFNLKFFWGIKALSKYHFTLHDFVFVNKVKKPLLKGFHSIYDIGFNLLRELVSLDFNLLFELIIL